MCVLSASEGEYSYSLRSHTLAVEAAKLGVLDSLLSVHTKLAPLVEGLGMPLVRAGDAGLRSRGASVDPGSIGDEGRAASYLLASSRASAAAATTPPTSRAAGLGGTGSEDEEKVVSAETSRRGRVSLLPVSGMRAMLPLANTSCERSELDLPTMLGVAESTRRRTRSPSTPSLSAASSAAGSAGAGEV